VFQCDNCGFERDRDVNAAINLEKEAVRLTVVETFHGTSLHSADTSIMKHEEKAGYC
jgi:putative transposase